LLIIHGAVELKNSSTPQITIYRGFTLICDTIEFVRATSNKDVNNDETGINPFRILVADNDRSVLKLYREALSLVNTDACGSGSNPGEKDDLYCINRFKSTPQSFDVVTCQRADEAVEAVKDSLIEIPEKKVEIPAQTKPEEQPTIPENKPEDSKKEKKQLGPFYFPTNPKGPIR
jgi:hypothetical protein